MSSEKGTSDASGFDADGAATTLASGDTVESTGSRLFVTYALSKRTTLYGMSGKATVDTIAGAASTLKSTTTSVGVKHSF
jgi:predicted porin